jgi:hypothetical protein
MSSMRGEHLYAVSIPIEVPRAGGRNFDVRLGPSEFQPAGMPQVLQLQLRGPQSQVLEFLRKMEDTLGTAIDHVENDR